MSNEANQTNQNQRGQEQDRKVSDQSKRPAGSEGVKEQGINRDQKGYSGK